MESLGDRLRKAREAKDISFDQAGKDTKIAVKHLRALELEDFSDFPGEAYIMGFLRNYGAYLGIDAQEILSLYRALKMQEQPIPVEQLLKQPSPLPKIAIGFGLAVLVFGLAAAVALLVTRPRNFGVPPVSRVPVQYEMSGDIYEKQFFIDDSIMIPAGENRYLIRLLSIGETVTIQSPGGQEILE
jgi:transcriptional regulator with XRE-family HTH domain